MLDAVTVGRVIQRVREEKRLSQEVVSSFADIGRTHLTRGAQADAGDVLPRQRGSADEAQRPDVHD